MSTPIEQTDLAQGRRKEQSQVSTPDGDSRTARFFAAIFLVLVAAALRLVPHPPNFSPIAGMALFGGAVFVRREIGMILPLAALFLSDCVLGFHDQMIAVYISILLISMMGFELRQNRTIGRVLSASIFASVFFFVVTNTAVWLTSPGYAKTFGGLATCWSAGLPFFQHTLAGDLITSGVLFGVWYWVEKFLPQSAPAVGLRES